MSDTVLLGILVNYQNVFKKLSEMPLKAVSGKKALEIRKALQKITEEIRIFNEAREEYIKQNGKEGENGSISIPEEDLPEANRYLNEMLTSEVDVKWDSVIDEETLSAIGGHVELVIKDIDVLEAVKLFKQEDPPKVEDAEIVE